MKKRICLYCGNESIKHGKTSKGIQRYRCKTCQKSYILDVSPLKGINLSPYKIKKFIGYMLDDVTLEVIARNLSINLKTAHYYRHLVFHSLSDYQETIILNGTIIIDETFISIREKKHRLTNPDNLETRGISYNQLCIITLVTLQGLGLAKVSSRAMAMPEDYKRLFNHNMGKVTLFLYDGNVRGYQFMKQFGDKINIRKEGKDTYSELRLESFQSNLKRYFFKHSGYRLKNVQHYLNFFVYRSNALILENPITQTERLKAFNKMIEDLYRKIKVTAKAVTYRTYIKDKGIDSILNKTNRK